VTCSRPEVPSGKAKVRSLVEMVGATMLAMRLCRSVSIGFWRYEHGVLIVFADLDIGLDYI